MKSTGGGNSKEYIKIFLHRGHDARAEKGQGSHEGKLDGTHLLAHGSESLLESLLLPS